MARSNQEAVATEQRWDRIPSKCPRCNHPIEIEEHSMDVYCQQCCWNEPYNPFDYDLGYEDFDDEDCDEDT